MTFYGLPIVPKDTPPSLLPPGAGTWQPPAVTRVS